MAACGDGPVEIRCRAGIRVTGPKGDRLAFYTPANHGATMGAANGRPASASGLCRSDSPTTPRRGYGATCTGLMYHLTEFTVMGVPVFVMHWTCNGVGAGPEEGRLTTPAMEKPGAAVPANAGQLILP